MNQARREQFILEWLDTENTLSIHEIVDKFDISPITARRDLVALEKRGLLIRTHGGAIKNSLAGNLFSFEKKAAQNKENKTGICRKAAELIDDNDILFIDSGSTLFFLCQYLNEKKNIRVITNSLPVLSELMNQMNVRIKLIGGELERERKAVYGPMAEKMVEQYHATKAFIGADGVSLKQGLTTFDEKEAAITSRIIASAEKVILLCDSSKIEKNSYVKFAPLSVIDTLITDNDISEDILNAYKNNGINILTSHDS